MFLENGSKLVLGSGFECHIASTLVLLFKNQGGRKSWGISPKVKMEAHMPRVTVRETFARLDVCWGLNPGPCMSEGEHSTIELHRSSAFGF